MTTAIWESIAKQLPQAQHRLACERIRKAEACNIHRIKFFPLDIGGAHHVDDLVGTRNADETVWLSDFDEMEITA